MNIDIRKKANHVKSDIHTLLLDERLPFFVEKPFEIRFEYSVEHKGDIYFLVIDEEGMVPLLCQRCFDECIYDYKHRTELAVCKDDLVVEKYQDSYDIIVLPDLILDIKGVLIDNMYLFLPENHENIDQCNKDQLKLMQKDSFL